MSATDTTEPARRTGRPAQRDVQRTTLDAWITANGSSSARVAADCAAAADMLGIPADEAPSRKGIDDMRVARFYPGIVAVLLLDRATNGQVTLEHWVRDRLRIGVRKRS